LNILAWNNHYERTFLAKTFSIYRSSAGSGKTRTLAKEYLKLALEHRGYYFRHILAVTFTNKSTQEMKDRILAYLDKFANGIQDELADELKAELRLDNNTFQERSQDVQREILHNYSQFSISTIDAFFQRVIRSFTRESGIMGDYRLEIEQDLVLEEVIDDLIDELGSNKELTEWVVEFAKDSLENERAWDVRASLRHFAEQIFREEFKVIEDDIIKETNDHNFFKELKSKLWQTKNFFLGKVSKPAAEALQIIQQKGWDITEFSYGKNSGLITFFEMYALQKNIREIKEPGDRVLNYFSKPEKWPSKTATDSADMIATAEQKLIPIINELVDTYKKHYKDALSAELVLKNMYVFGLIADISRKLREYNHRNNLMLLADAPKFLNGVIADSDTPFIYEKVGSFYKNFLIDEFQDTSGYQWKNFLPLLTNSLDQGNRSIVVGDVKQAVYRWRGGDLKLLQRQVEKQIGKDRVSTLELDTNYRSGARIIEFNNVLFKNAATLVKDITSGDLPEASFSDVAQKDFKKHEGFVQVRFIQDAEDKNWQQLAMEQIPKQLEQLQLIGVKLNDIAILVRKNSEGQQIAANLLQYKNSPLANPACRYDVISNESLRLDGAASVNLLLAAMRYMQFPEDSIARAQLSYEFSRIRKSDLPLNEVFKVANQVFFENNLPDAFSKSKAWLKRLPLFELTETLIEIFKLGEVKGELAYLQAFQELVLEFYSRERNDVGAFLEWWEDNKHKKSLQISGEVDAVQIVTIHKSKGLQFKYVLIPFCSWSMDHDSFNAPLLWVSSDTNQFKDAGHVPVEYSSKLKESCFDSFYNEECVRSYLDNLNLLYVAFTRAEHALLVTAPHPKNRSMRGYSVAKLLMESIERDEELKKSWDDKAVTWKSGVLTVIQKDKKPEAEALQLDVYPVSRWRDKLVIKRQSVSYFEDSAEQQEKVKHGIHMHTVLSRIQYTDEIPETLRTIVQEGLITDDEKEALGNQLTDLLSNSIISDWFSKSWTVRTEVPIILPGGDENRIDRLMIKGKKAIVVDFKTGAHSRDDVQQVKAYVDILRQMNFADVEGYILYLKDREVFNINDLKPKSSKKKEDKDQLGLF
jgi:ATP-dependent helicase/nuclease subunit A